jgi:hypothetical protein
MDVMLGLLMSAGALFLFDRRAHLLCHNDEGAQGGSFLNRLAADGNRYAQPIRAVASVFNSGTGEGF